MSVVPAITAFLSALAASLFLVVIFRSMARRLDLMDRPGDNHKQHQHSVPLLGGMAVYCSWALTIFAGIAAARCGWLENSSISGFAEVSDGIQLSGRSLLFLFAGATMALILGMIDDIFPMSAKVKFSGQFLVALLAVYGGDIRLDFCPLPVVGEMLTLFWIMLLMNSINFFDNMDGLAAGTVAIAFALFGVVAYLSGQYLMTVFCGAALGAVCGFWYFNTAPATIFLGDSGSHFLGYLAAVVAVKTTYMHSTGEFFGVQVLMPLFILALPLFDTAMVVVIRTLNKKPFWIGDHNHISHRFVKMGLSREKAVILVHLLALVIGLGVLPLYWGDGATATVVLIQSFLILGVVSFLQFTLGREKK